VSLSDQIERSRKRLLRQIAADMKRTRDTFYDCTSPVGTKTIDKSNGRVLLLNGDMFYSPNCSRTVTLPPAQLQVSPVSSDVTAVCQPMWWSLETVHLAFMPLDHTTFGAFQEIFETRGIDYHRKLGFALATGKILAWNRLEVHLKHTADVLLKRAFVPAFPDLIHSALVCTGFHRRPEDLRRLVHNTRTWFFYWFAQISYAIALNISCEQEPISMAFDSLADVPAWFRYLAKGEWPEWYLGDLMITTAMFDVSVPRAGLFLDLSPSRPHYQFSVDWFIAFGVPVWYRWNSDSASCGDERLSPLPHQFQHAVTLLHQTPVQHDQPWIAFLEDRRIRCERMRLRETEQQREVRLARERQPPTASAAVYEWEIGLDGQYQRVPVPARMRAEVLEDYGRDQKVYNSFMNEWDCAHEMGEKHIDELEVDAQEDDDMEPILPLYPRTEFDPSNDTYPQSLPRQPYRLAPSVSVWDEVDGHEDDDMEPILPLDPRTEFDPSNVTYPQSLPRQPYRLAPSVSVWELDSDVHQFEAISILHEYYGFVPPLPPALNSTHAEIDSNARLKYTKLIGMTRIDNPYFSSPVAVHAIHFLQSMVGKTNPESDLWDLAPGNRMSLAGCQRIAHLKKIEPFYVFDFGQSATVPWMLAVERPDVALLVCRLDKDYNDFELARALLQRGVSIRTLRPLPASPARHPPLIPLPIRLPEYEFSASDLMAYEDRLQQLLRIPRISRSALMAGGIVWRLAIHVGFTGVLMGPTAAVMNTKIGESFPVIGASISLWDDICTERELDLICGAYVCFNGESLHLDLIMKI
jgi:hypothetical protein